MKTNPLRPLRTLLPAALVILGCASLSATMLVDTNFTDGTLQGWRSDYMSTSQPTLSVEADGPDGNYLRVHGNVAFRGAYVNFSEKVTLGVGQSLSLSFDYRRTGGADNNQGLRFGLFSFHTGDTPDNSSDNGYFLAAPLGVDGKLRLSRDYNGSSNDPASGSDTLLLAESAADLNLALNDWYSISFVLERTTETSMVLTASVDDVTLTYTLTGSNLIDSFGMFYIGSGNINPRFSLDNVKVELQQIPEAGTVWFGLGAVAALLVLRKYSRRK